MNGQFVFIKAGLFLIILISNAVADNYPNGNNETRAVRQGSKAKLNCNRARGVKIKHSWWKDGREIKQTKRRKLRKKGMLLIKNFSSRDEGVYTCRDRKRNIVKKIRLLLEEIHGKPVFDNKQSFRLTRFALAGSRIKLDCVAQGTQPIVYRWTRNGKALSHVKYKAYGPSLKINKLILDDAGNYTCVASNVFGNSNCSYEVKVYEVVRAKPFLQPEFPRDTRAVVGENASMECYELFSNKMGTIVDFRWLLWKVKPTKKREQRLIVLARNGNFTDNFLIEALINPLYYDSIDRKDNDRILYGSRMNLYNVSKEKDGYYSCIACNHLGCSIRSARLTIIDKIVSIPGGGGDSSNALSPLKNTPTFQQRTIYIAISVAGGFVVLIFIVICVVCWRALKREKRHESECIEESPTDTNLNKKDLIKFQKSNGISLVSLETTATTTTTPLIHKCRTGSDSLWSKSFQQRMQQPSSPQSANVCLEMLDIPLDKEWEIEKEDLVLGETLGEGAFGVVVKAEALSLPSKPGFLSTVAVKMLKADATEHELHDLLSEMETMKQIGKHRNIINFIGCCTQNGSLCIVVEYAPHGNLRQYLRSNRPSVLESSDESYDSPLTLAILVSFAFQISKGMEFLANHQCIHRDLATRNVLVGEDFVMKIADFGLARNVREADYYRKTTDGRLPIKWLSIEALFDRVYTTQSDVWAFGVVLWEIFTLGGSPYPSIPVEKLFKLLKSGYRMKRPHGCPSEIYEVMLECWYENANLRPSFTNLVRRFDSFLQSVTVNDYIQVFADSMECIHEEEENLESEAAEVVSEDSADEETVFNALEESTV